MQYRFFHVTDPETLKRIHRFRYRIWCEELGYTIPNRERYESDQYDRYCDQFMALDSKGDICASMRLIHHSPVGYPTENAIELPEEARIYPRNKLGEMSRIFIHRDYRNMKDTRILINTIVKSLAYVKIKQHGIEYCYGSLEPSFLRLVNMLKIPYMPIGEAQKYHGIDDGTLRCPAILYTRGLELYNPRLLKQWNREKTPHQTSHRPDLAKIH